MGLELPTEDFAVFKGEASVLEFNAVDLDAEGERWVGDTVANRAGDLKDESRAVLKWAAVLVNTLVGSQGEELRQEITAGEPSVSVDRREE